MSNRPVARARSVVRVALLLASLAAVPVASAQYGADGSVNQASQAQRSATNVARADLNRALGALKAAQERAGATFKAAPELWQAEDELETAQKELEEAQKPVLDKLTDDPQYKAEKAKQDEAEAKIRQEFQKAVEADPASTKPTSPLPKDHDPTDKSTVTAETERLNVPVPSDAQIAAATDKAIQRNKLRELQDAAIAADPKAAAAAAKVDAAVEKLKRLQLTHRAELLNNPEYKAALDQVHAARSRVQQAAGANYRGYGSYRGTIGTNYDPAVR